MIVASISADDESRTLVLGLTRRNIERLIAGQPMRIDAEHHPGFPEDLRICIVFGETERAITELLKPMLGEETKFIAVPHPDDRPKGVS